MTVKWTAWGGLRETRKGGDAAPPRDVTDIHVCDVVRRWWSWFSSPSERNCASAHDQRQVRVCDRSNDVVHKEQWNGDMFYSFWVFTSLFDLSWTLCFWRRKVPRIHTVLHPFQEYLSENHVVNLLLCTRIHTYMLNTYFAKEHVLLSYASRWLKWPKMITILFAYPVRYNKEKPYHWSFEVNFRRFSRSI